jgi:hypothetical protein
MKRSEMIAKLVEVLRNAECLDEYLTPAGIRLSAENILSELEKAGMLPPYREKTEEEKDRIDAINQYMYTHTWGDE